MVKKVINVGGKEVAFRSSATVPRLYRAKFKRDIFKDLAKLESSLKNSAFSFEYFFIFIILFIILFRNVLNFQII